ncbi:hypothetical protein QUF72_15955 [Desulfobacterales bacterium HSG2]|nr:hypothetical protein [Desulfobacterales bacterium HSG2]
MNNSKKHVMSVLMDANEQISFDVRNIQKMIEGRIQLYKRMTLFLSGAVFFVISLITYSVMNTFRELKKINEALALDPYEKPDDVTLVVLRRLE